MKISQHRRAAHNYRVRAWPGGAQGLRQEITKRYGESVAAIIEGCTDTDTIPKPPWRERKERYLEHLVEASPAVLLVACCDKLHNLRSTLADYQRRGFDDGRSAEDLRQGLFRRHLRKTVVGILATQRRLDRRSAAFVDSIKASAPTTEKKG